MENKKALVIIPTYNELENLPKLLPEVFYMKNDHADKEDYTYTSKEWDYGANLNEKYKFNKYMYKEELDEEISKLVMESITS